MAGTVNVTLKQLTQNDNKILGRSTQLRKEKTAPPDKFHTRKLKTLTSSWTPLVNRASNLQICKERTELVVNWFELWTDRQRKYFLDQLFRHCSRAQLLFIQNWFRERVPLRHLDFTTVLPRFLSLYIFSFLDPRSLSRAAMVSWNWNFLTSQDAVWTQKCSRRGWYLPYTPDDNEYGAWKRHYVACIQTLDMNVPSKDKSDLYGTISDGSGIKRPKKKTNRLSLNQSVEVLQSRPPWQPTDKTPRDMDRSAKSIYEDHNPNDPLTHPSLSMHHNKYGIVKTGLLSRSDQHRILEAEDDPDLQVRLKTLMSKSLELESFEERRMMDLVNQPWEPPRPNMLPGQTRPNISGIEYSGKSNNKVGQPISKSFPNQPNPRIVFISSRVPGAEVLVDAVNFGVIPIVYEYEGTTLDSLLTQLASCLQGRQAQSIGIFIHSENPWELRFVHGDTVTLENSESANYVTFFQNLANHVLPSAQKGHIDFFAPLGSCEQGEALMKQLNMLTGATFTSPTGIVGSYNHVNSDWSSNPEGSAPPKHYFCKSKMNVWVNTADRVKEACEVTRKLITRFFDQKQKDLVSQLVGQIVFDVTGQTDLEGITEISAALVDGLIQLGNEQNRADDEDCLASRKPLEYLAGYLLEKADNAFVNNQTLSKSGSKMGGVGTLGSHLKLDEQFDESLQNSEYTDASEYDNEVAQINRKTLKQKKSSKYSKVDDEDSDEIQEDISEDVSAEEYISDQDEGTLRKSKRIPKPTKSHGLPTARKSKDFSLSKSYQRKSNKSGQSTLRLTIDQLRDAPEKRTAIAKEIVASEVEYMRTLEIMETAFVDTLRSAAHSNHAILSEHNLQIIFTDAMTLLEMSRGLAAELKQRIADWGPQQCFGDIFVKFTSNLKGYSNFLKNYPTVLTTIERATENSPEFRAFLRRTERTPKTKMLILAELLLAPTRRISEYTRLLTWFQTYTPKDHADRTDLKLAIKVFADFEDLIRDCKKRSENERELIELQKSIIKCPVLLEANRFLVRHQDISQLREPSEGPEAYQQTGTLGMFLFNDGLLVTQRIIKHIPFQYAKEYKYVFRSVSGVVRLRIEDIQDSKYVRNAFKMHTPSRSWVCQTDDLDTKVNWITLVKNTVIAALEDAD